MTAILIILALSFCFGAGCFVGAVIHFANPTDEHPIPSDQDARLIDLHREIHGEEWGV